MPELVTINLGGIPISLSPDLLKGEYTGIARAGDFYTSENPEIDLKVHCGRFPAWGLGKAFFETNQGWQLFHSNEKRIFKTRTTTQDPNLLGEFPRDFRSGDIYVASPTGAPDHFVFPFGYPMGELYIISLLGTGLGMLSHAAGVIYEGKGYLFTGNGGAGKTTTARLWQAFPGAKVVNDDKVILRNVSGEFRLYGTPWHGEGGMALPDWAPLERVFILKKAGENFTKSLSHAEAATGMLGRGFIPLWDHQAMDFTLTLLDELIQNVDCRELHFLPDASAVEFVLNLRD